MSDLPSVINDWKNLLPLMLTHITYNMHKRKASQYTKHHLEPYP